MDEYAGRVLADRYRLPRIPDGEEPPLTPAFDTHSGQEVLAHQVPLPEEVSAEVLIDADGEEELPDVLSPDEDPGQRALRAAIAAAQLPDHPRLVQVYDVFLDGGSLWVISEWVFGQSLSEVIAEQPLSPYRAAEIGADVLTALRAVHMHHWTHRNITADTVLVCDDGRAMLGGLCVAAAEEAICGSDPVPTGEPDLAMAPAGGGPPWERVRDLRLVLIGPCTERWAPEQAGPLPVQLPSQEGLPEWAEPVSIPQEQAHEGPASDLWALGALMFRAVQGYPAFPEEDPLELIDMVRTEPPAFAEECGPLRPVVESLMRKDPRTRPDPEEVQGWLRSLVRAAPEPDVGREPAEPPVDQHNKVVEIRRRGEVAQQPPRDGAVVHRGRHARGKPERRPRRLGMMVLGFVLTAVVLTFAAAALLLPRSDKGHGQGTAPGSGAQGSTSAQSLPPGLDLGSDFSMHTDPNGFSLALHNDLNPQGKTDQGQVWFNDGDDVDMIVVPGRDTTKKFGDDLADYQLHKEPELKRFRNADWSATYGLRQFTLGGLPAVQGEFRWRDKQRNEFYARNLVVLRDGEYHVVLVMGPERDHSDVALFFEKAAQTYRAIR